MSLAAGARFGPYEILAPIGAGGMGEVYKARDLRLNRVVAIKVLPPEVKDFPDRRQRFLREAQAVAALEHPHICVLHDIGVEGGVDFLVMECLEGETLARRLQRGRLLTDQVLRSAIEIGSALEKAHRQGIVHRDLKPANIMLTKSGVKLLDFGLAKLRPAANVAVTQASAAVTEAPLTGEGIIVGTVEYMAPEQLEGREADARTDIFAFGAILYEMATGEKAFTSTSQASLIAAILKHMPAQISTLTPTSPRALDDIVQRCLAKDPEERWQTSADLTFALRRTHEEVSRGSPPSDTRLSQVQRRVNSRLSLAALAVLALASLTLAVWSRSSTGPVQQPPVRLLLSQNSVAAIREFPAVAISPDGQQVAFVAEQEGVRRLYRRELQGIDAVVLPGTENALAPFFSPDGRRLGFFADGRLKAVALAGGAPIVLAGVVNARGAAWANDDTIVYSPSTDAGLWQVSANGGTPQQLVAPDPDKGERSFRWPALLPGNDAVVFTLATSQILSFDDARVMVRSLRTGEQRELIRGGSYPTFVAPDLLLYARAGALYAVPFDPIRQEITGAPVTVLDDLVTYPDSGAAQYALASNGTLVYVRGGASTRQATLAWLDRTGAPTRLKVPPLPYLRVSLSRTGDQAAVDIDGANGSIWLLDLSPSTAATSVLPMTRLTLEWSNNLPFWTPDGTRVGFVSARRGIRTLFWQSVDGGSGAERLVTQHQSDITGASISPDSKTLIFAERTTASGTDLWTMPLDGERKPTGFLQTSFHEQMPQFSPDGRWVAYVSDESGREEVFVRPYPGPGRKWKISSSGGTEPLWADGGDELFYRTSDGVMGARVETSRAFSAGEPTLLFQQQRPGLIAIGGSYAVAPDGRFLMVLELPSPEVEVPITVVLNWLGDVRRRLSLPPSR